MTEEGSDNHAISCSIMHFFLGPMVAGMMIEQFLLGTICYHTTTYFRYHFNSDTFFCKSIVVCLVAFTASLGILDFITLYRRLVSDYGECEKFDTQDWTAWMEPSLTACIAFVAHIFYIFRCWAVIRSPVVCISLGVVALSALISGITSTIFCFSIGRVSKLEEVIIPAIIWFASSGICDLGIASVLVLYFWRRESVLRSTNTVITRLRRTSVETGLLTAVCALVNLILFASMPEKGYGMLVHYPMSHVYTLSVLYTLLGRQDLRHILDEGSGTLVSDFRSSFLVAGVLSTTSLDNQFKDDGLRLRNKMSNIVVHNDCQLKPRQSQEEGVV